MHSINYRQIIISVLLLFITMTAQSQNSQKASITADKRELISQLRLMNDTLQNAIMRDDKEAAEMIINRAIQKAMQLDPHHILTAYYISQKGDLIYRAGKPLEAIELLEKARTIYDLYPSNNSQIAQLSNLGMVYRDIDRLDSAASVLMKAEKLIMAIPPAGRDEQLLAYVCNGLGGIMAGINDNTAAIIYQRKAIELFKKFRNPEFVGASANLINLLALNGLKDEALHEISSLKQIINKQYGNKHPVLWRIYSFEAVLFQDDPITQNQAEEKFLAALDLLSKTQQESLDIAILMSTVATFYQQKKIDFIKAKHLREESLSIFDKLGFSEDILVARNLNDLASLYIRTAEYDKVSGLMNRSQQIMLKKQKENFGFTSANQKERINKDLMLPLQNIIDFAAQIVPLTNDTLIQQLSYDAALNLNGSLLDDARQIRNVVNKSGDTTLIRLYKDWLALKEAAVTMAREQKTDAQEKIENIEQQLAQRSIKIRSIQASNQVNWQQIRAKLAPDEVSIAFVRYNDPEVSYGALVIRQDYKYPRMLLLGSESHLIQIMTSVQASSELYGTARGTPIQDIVYGDSVYNFIWKPIEPLLKGVKRVYFSPEGLLHRIAFDAIPLPKGESIQSESGLYVGKKYELYPLFNTRAIVTKSQPFLWKAPMSALLLGGISYDIPKNLQSNGTVSGQRTIINTSVNFLKTDFSPFTSLASTGPEVMAIHKLLPGSELLLSSKANEQQLRNHSGNSAPTILHIATHGFYIPNKVEADSLSEQDGPFLRSGLALAGANRLWNDSLPSNERDDGILTAYEVAYLDFSSTKLVVLSACETALGDIRGPEGVFGLQRAFRMAGAEKILMSLWPVADSPTQELMTNFYKQLRSGKDAQTAFRAAKKIIQAKYPNPSVWAAFILIE